MQRQERKGRHVEKMRAQYRHSIQFGSGPSLSFVWGPVRAPLVGPWWVPFAFFTGPMRAARNGPISNDVLAD